MERAEERRAPPFARAVLWSLPVVRVGLVPIFVAMALRIQDLAGAGSDTQPLRRVLVIILAIIALSDAADGWLARRYRLASQAGAVVDAASDKVAQLVLLALFTFTQGPAFEALPIWLLAAVLGRDLTLLVGWLALRWRRVPFEVVHRVHGRASLVAVFAALFWVTIGLPASGVPVVSLVAVVVAAASVVSYAFEVRRSSRDAP
jgi:phosphatidylglycerophosphate synthase